MSDHNLDFVITKATQGDDGIKRWAATVSKFAMDEQDDEVTKNFFGHSIQKISDGEHPMPALVVSHYDDPRASVAFESVPEIFTAGTTTKIYVDRDKPKAKGVFADTPLGDATYAAIRADLDNNLEHEERVRISMAWRPEKGGVEKSSVDGHNIHNRGLIRHFAATRVPIVKETEIMADVTEKSEAKKTKYGDAVSIVGEDLAGQLEDEAIGLARDKADDGQLYEKAKDTNGKFDMGACLTKELGAGKDRKQALAICLSMSRRKKKTENSTHASKDIEKSNGLGLGPRSREVRRRLNECMKAQKAAGIKRPAAREFCLGQEKKRRRQEVQDAIVRSEAEDDIVALFEKIDLSLPVDECIQVYISDHDMSREEAVKFCNSDKAKEARREEQEEKAYTVDELIERIVSDDEIQVVTKATEEDEELANELMAVIEEFAATNAAIVESGSEKSDVQSDVNLESGESQEADPDVNTVNPEKSGVVESNEDVVLMQKYFDLISTALVNPELDRTEKALIFNHAMEEIQKMSEDAIQVSTPASPQDMAEVLKAALEEVLAPMTLQQTIMIERINELEQEKAEYSNAVPRPRQIVYNAAMNEKADANDNGGALTAKQAAALTVREALGSN